MELLFEQLRNHLVDINKLMDLEHVPLDDVILFLRRTRVDPQPLGHLDVQQRIGWHEGAAVRREVFVVRDERRIDLVIGRKEIGRQIRMVQLRLASNVAKIN